jgi:hypothetical protein
MAQRQKNNVLLLCEFGYVYHRMALDLLRKNEKQKARKHLVSAKKQYRRCKARAPAGKQRTKAIRGLRDIERTLRFTK